MKVPKVLKRVKVYPGIPHFAAATKLYTFQTLILRHPKYATESIEDKFGGLFFVIGGDDDWEFSEENITVDGLQAQQIVYKDQNKKALFIDGGDVVYVFGLAVNDRKLLDSPIANRFFKPFRIRRNFQKNSKESKLVRN